MATATLGGGCFWCLEAVYQRLEGVNQVVSGYAGGQMDNPDYRSVTTGKTGHAEVVRIDYDPAVIDFEKLLDVFFTIHDPTTADRQGADIGPQYRSIILWEDEDQLATANAVIERLTREGAYTDPIVTQVQPLETFYPGEDYHQDYYRQNTSAPYCQMVVVPKLEKAEARFADRFKR